MSQNLCLVCCYTFQEKRSRFISDEARQGFHKFSSDLGFSFQNKGKGQPKTSSLELPFGDAITVCGDCLSLIVLYVQRSSVQLEQEEKLEELQRAVVKALKDLSVVVNDVQTHINELHDIVRGGDESSLHKFVKKDASVGRGGEEAKSFREKILSVNNGSCCPIKAARLTQGYMDMILPTVSVQSDLVKVEPEDYVNPCDEMDYSDNSFGDELEKPCHQDVTTESFEDSTSYFGHGTTKSAREEPSFSKRNAGKLVTYCDAPGLQPQTESSDAESETNASDNDDAASNFSEDCVIPKRTMRRIRGRPPNRSTRGPGRPRKVKPEPLHHKANELSQSPEDWKNDLIGRILEQWGSLSEAVNQNSTDENGSKELENIAKEAEPSSPQEETVEIQDGNMQIIDGELQFRGIKVQIQEQQKALMCMRCGKKFKEDKVKTEFEIPVETVMRDHIITKHPPPKKRRRVIMEVTPYTSTTRSKVTYKIACKNLYTYTRRCRNSDGRGYYRCDARKANCGATILFVNGEYVRMKNGWTDDGFHTLHPPDPVRTEEQLVLGKAKEYSLSNPTMTIHEVFNKIVKDSNGNLPLPAKRLKRILHVSRYGHQRLPEEEKRNRVYHCPDCEKSCRDARGLARHIKTQHKSPLKPDGSSITELSSSDKFNGPSKLKRSPKRIDRKFKNEPLPSSSTSGAASSALGTPAGNQAPCGIFADSAQATNFVNRCITAIMQQVGIPVPPTNAVTPADRQVAPTSVASSTSSNSPTASGSPVPEPHESNSSSIPYPSTTQASSIQQRSSSSHPYNNQNPSQWNQFSIPSHGHPQTQGQFNLTSNNSHPNQLQLWPWNAGQQ
ncbi:unnamed protein product [Orchesella dallaii]|uniref:C2H2-type domain-containing protein n=1 Tax=Orchesella dallaii TaxID=48710 RepID=A0ABP1QCH2_9HEXA